MSVVASIESGNLDPDFREALRTLLSRKSEAYLEFPSTADAPGVCICTSYADLRHIIETEYKTKLKSRPTVPANYRAGGARRRLPDAASTTEEGSKHRYADVGTQTTASPEPVVCTGQVESAPESWSCRNRKSRRAPVSRTICSSSTETETETETAVDKPVHQAGSQSLLSLSSYMFPY